MKKIHLFIVAVFAFCIASSQQFEANWDIPE